MAILTLQQRATEIGRIRLGHQEEKNGKRRPQKLDRFRFTAQSRELIERVANEYGGSVQEWAPAQGGVSQWEVFSEAQRVPVLVPPQPVSQYFETWSSGGIQRRCDGLQEMVSGGDCLCSAEEMPCKPYTRLSVMLRDVAGLGLWRLETHGYYAALELPGLAQFLATASDYVPAFIELQWRRVKKAGEKHAREFVVPVLDVEQTPAALLGGQAPPQAAVTGARPAAIVDFDSYKEAGSRATTIEELQELWRVASRDGALSSEVKRHLELCVSKLKAPRLDPPRQSAQPTGPAESADSVWLQIVQKAPPEWTSDQLEAQFEAYTGVRVEQANAQDMREYLDRGMP